MTMEIIRNLLQLKKLAKSKVNKCYIGQKSRGAKSKKAFLELSKETKEPKSLTIQIRLLSKVVAHK